MIDLFSRKNQNWNRLGKRLWLGSGLTAFQQPSSKCMALWKLSCSRYVTCSFVSKFLIGLMVFYQKIFFGFLVVKRFNFVQFDFWIGLTFNVIICIENSFYSIINHFLCPGPHIQTQDLWIFNSYLSFSISSCLNDFNKPGEKSRSRLVYGGNFIASEKLVKREGD